MIAKDKLFTKEYPHVTLHCSKIHKPIQSKIFLEKLYNSLPIILDTLDSLDTLDPLSTQEYTYGPELDEVLSINLKSVFYI